MSRIRTRLSALAVLLGAACSSTPDQANSGSVVPMPGGGNESASMAGVAGVVAVEGGASGMAGGSLGGALAGVGMFGGAGGGGGGGASGGGAAGAAGSAGQPGKALCPIPQLVCDDFEAGDLEGFEVLETGGSFAIDATHVYSGGSSVLLTIPANQRGGFLEVAGAPLFPLTSNTVWGRVMVYFEDLPNGHFDTVRGAPEGGGTPWYNIGGQGKALLFNYYSGALDCWSTVANKPPLPLKKWVCWEFQIDGSKNAMTLWVDGQQTHSMSGTGAGCVGGKQGTWSAPSFGSVRLGQFNAQTAGNQTRVWLDDVALGTSARIGCPDLSATAR